MWPFEISKVQNIRKEMDLDVADRIVIGFHAPDEVARALMEFKDYISNETLAVSIVRDDKAETECDLNGQPCKVAVGKA